ncbi:uncharacterized protein LOC126802330 [Argentina anserina]|uniref:uncharacterized protein LOC126802330 n=1 Tax=Argentina anserina TaxID=57926 RepID=UPI0021767208|nr:uncharacterized protein LOC126802330 [Potentilla anserina]XP_050385901.1 uncharacterized protein LOC126802330 [Potentilla anserina]
MPFPPDDDEIRSIRIQGLAPLMSAKYLFQCFYDNAEVLAATVLRVNNLMGDWDSDTVRYMEVEQCGFVEFASHGIAQSVLTSYNGELMPNYDDIRYCLSWDTQGFGTRWRFDRAYQDRSFFGYNWSAHEYDAKAVIKLYKDSIPLIDLDKDSTYGVAKKRASEIEAAYPNTRLKLIDISLTQYAGHRELSSIIHQWNQELYPMGNIGISDLHFNCMYYGYSKTKEKELYLCFNEISQINKVCYVFRTIKLSELLECFCEFNIGTRTLTKCNYCTAKPEHQLRQRAWIFPWEDAASCGGEEAKLPAYMGCCSSGSSIFFAGGMVPLPPPDPKTIGDYAPSGAVYSFTPKCTRWQRHDWSFKKEKPNPLLFEVNGNLYCLARQPIGGLIKHPTFEVYNSRSGECEALPDPPFYKLEREHSLFPGPRLKLSCTIVGTKILISSRLESSNSPIMCFDVNDKENKWREMTSLFGGKGFPFDGRALVLDVNDNTHVMFSFRECEIYVSLLHSLDEGSICISEDNRLHGWFMLQDLMGDFDEQSYTFVDLGDQKVGFILCGNRLSAEKWDNDMDPCRKARALIVVIHYKVVDSTCLINDIVACRTFDYNCHSPSIYGNKLVGSFVA